MEESVQMPLPSHEVLGDSVAWGGCTIIYLLGQQLHFELFDFSYQVLNVAEVERAFMHAHRNPPSLQVKHRANFVAKSSLTRIHSFDLNIQGFRVV